MGEGGNGIVVKVTSPDGRAIARKYCTPWKINGRLIGRPEAQKKVLLAYAKYNTRVHCDEVGVFSLCYFGHVWDVTEFYKIAQSHNCQIRIDAVIRPNETPEVFHYNLSSCVPVLAASSMGIVDMELCGATAYQEMPLKTLDLLALVFSICDASVSALKQGRIIVDIKPENIARAGEEERWYLIDIDDVPRIEEPRAMEMSTYTTKDCCNVVDKMVAAIIITVALASGLMSKEMSVQHYWFRSQDLATSQTLANYMHPALSNFLAPVHTQNAIQMLEQSRAMAKTMAAHFS